MPKCGISNLIYLYKTGKGSKMPVYSREFSNGKGFKMPENEKRVYNLGVEADGSFYYQENFIVPPDRNPAAAAARVCSKIIAEWAAADFGESRDIVIRFIPSKQKV